jgi:exosome complex RNA-binding protein Rrp42 (RNase PH superfamily)
MFNSLSNTEIRFIKRGCELGIRSDGRGLSDYRCLQIENNILPHVNGSSRVRLGNGMEVICSVKLDVVQPAPTFPDRGMVTVCADFSPSCGLKVDDRHRAELSSRLGERLQSFILGSSCIDLQNLSIIFGKYCWLVHIDFVLCQLDGDPLDVCSIASYAALKSTVVPNVELILGGSGLAEDFQLSTDISTAVPLKIHRVPICVTVVKISSSIMLDATSVEHLSADYGFAVSVDKDLNFCGFFKLHGKSSITIPDMSAIFEVRITCKSFHSVLYALF